MGLHAFETEGSQQPNAGLLLSLLFTHEGAWFPLQRLGHEAQIKKALEWSSQAITWPLFTGDY